MKTIIKTHQQQSLESLELEAQALRNLIERRNAWLNDPVNRLKSTYSAVSGDTLELMLELQQLENDIETIKRRNNYENIKSNSAETCR